MYKGFCSSEEEESILKEGKEELVDGTGIGEGKGG